MGLKALIDAYNRGDRYQIPAKLDHMLNWLKIGETRHMTWGGETRQVVKRRDGTIAVS